MHSVRILYNVLVQVLRIYIIQNLFINIIQLKLNKLNKHKPERIYTKAFVHSWTIQEEDGKSSFKQQCPVQRPISVKSIHRTAFAFRSDKLIFVAHSRIIFTNKTSDKLKHKCSAL